MVYNALNNIAIKFVEAKIIEQKDIKSKLNEICKVLNLKSSKNILVNESETSNLYQDIDEVRKFLLETTSLSNQEIENKINYVLSIFVPSQDELDVIFKKSKDPFKLLKEISLLSYYIKKDKNDKNLIWPYSTKYGNFMISINKAKPEKTIEEIKRAKMAKPNPNKPKCVICYENVGYSADSFSDSRENLRVIKKQMPGGPWFFQYSPYAYLNNHFVLNNMKHTPMRISDNTIKNLVAFVNENPKYFLGSNADLEIVGGSLLAHDHYQGGEDVLPIMNAKTQKSFKVDMSFVDVLNWPLNAVRLRSKNSNEIISIGNYLVNNWKHFDDESIVKNFNNNSSTLILNKQSNGEYHLYIIFRNNTVSKERPFGNFHFHHDKFNIKQENIGLMEAAGLAILPQRLERELIEVARLASKNKLDEIKKSDSLKKHFNWITKLINEGNKINEKIIFDYASDVFVSGLEDCRVIKNNIFLAWIESLIHDDKIEISNKSGLKLSILRQGFTFEKIEINNKNILLSYKDKSSYYSNSILLNSFVAPVAGRIEGNKVKNVFSNKEISLPTDSNNNFIHSMDYSTTKVAFNFEKPIENNDSITLKANKKMFNQDINVIYKFNIELILSKNSNQFKIKYQIKANDDFIANPTQHFYWSFPTKETIQDYLINIDKNNSYWELNKNSNPVKIKKFKLDNQLNSIKQISNELSDEQHKIINGLIDHPIINSKKEIKLVCSEYQLLFKSKITDFVLYTHNFASNEELKHNKPINSGLCIEFQHPPTSLKNKNLNDVWFKGNQKYTNEITIKINKEKK